MSDYPRKKRSKRVPVQQAPYSVTPAIEVKPPAKVSLMDRIRAWLRR